MILVKDNKLQAELLSSEGTLSSKTIKDYDYIEFKNDFEQIIDILSTNLLVHSLYQEYLKYEITEDLKYYLIMMFMIVVLLVILYLMKIHLF